MLRKDIQVRPRSVWLVLALFAAVTVPAALGAGAPSVQSLREQDAALAAKSRSAVLSLYALQSRLDRAQAALAADEAQAASLRRERALVADQIAIARHGIAISQRRLAARVRVLYERGGVDPLAVVLGAQSLDAALSTLDGMHQIASGDASVLQQVRSAERELTGLRRTLAARQRRLDDVVRAAAATTQTLAAARAERKRYLAGLEAQRQLTGAAIARLTAAARAAQARAQALEAAPPVPIERDQSPAPSPSAAPAAAAPVEGGRTITVVATGYALPGRTATGLPVGWGVVAVDPSVIPLGTRLTIPGYGEGVAADVGSAIQGGTVDLWFPTTAQAQAWGRRQVTITLR